MKMTPFHYLTNHLVCEARGAAGSSKHACTILCPAVRNNCFSTVVMHQPVHSLLRTKRRTNFNLWFFLTLKLSPSSTNLVWLQPLINSLKSVSNVFHSVEKSFSGVKSGHANSIDCRKQMSRWDLMRLLCFKNLHRLGCIILYMDLTMKDGNKCWN